MEGGKYSGGGCGKVVRSVEDGATHGCILSVNSIKPHAGNGSGYNLKITPKTILVLSMELREVDERWDGTIYPTGATTKIGSSELEIFYTTAQQAATLIIESGKTVAEIISENPKHWLTPQEYERFLHIGR